MPYGLPSFPKNTFPNEAPPSWFHPADPRPSTKPQPKMSQKSDDAASMMSTSTFSSSVSLLKSKISPKSKEVKDTKTRKSPKAPKPLPDYNARAKNAEALMVWATLR